VNTPPPAGEAVPATMLSQDSLAPRGFKSGVVIPADIRVSLVRIEASNLDSVISILFSVVFGIFGVYLGSWLSSDRAMTKLELLGFISFGIFAIFLLIWWLLIKRLLLREGITLPMSVLAQLSATSAQKTVE